MRIFWRIIGFFLIVGVVLALWFLVFRKLNTSSPSLPSVKDIGSASPHTVDSRKLALEHVTLQVVYFVPRDRQELMQIDWDATVTKALAMMQAFHRLQFRNTSDIAYRMVPVPIIGDLDGSIYDGTDTNRGNPQAFKIIGEELDRRLGAVSVGDSDAFSVRLVIYEGVGALGGDGQILVSSGYLRQNISLTASVLYHELGHTFGLEDAYEYEHGTPLDEDIMGLGRNQPIGQVYLSEKAKRELGIMN